MRQLHVETSRLVFATVLLLSSSACHSSYPARVDASEPSRLTIAIDGGHEADADYDITLYVRHQGQELSAHAFIQVQTTTDAIANQLRSALESKGIAVQSSSDDLTRSLALPGILLFSAQDELVGTSMRKLERGGANAQAGNVTLRMNR